jgi:hypothetical protein
LAFGFIEAKAGGKSLAKVTVSNLVLACSTVLSATQARVTKAKEREGKRNKDLQIRGLKNLGSICMLSRRVKLVHLSFKRCLPNHDVEK